MNVQLHRVVSLLLASCLAIVGTTAAHAAPAPDIAAYQAAALYSARQNGDAMLVLKGDQIVFETYQNGYDASKPHVLASATKSFSCAIAVAAKMEGLLSFDEPASKTLTEWKSDPLRSKITVRQILNFTDGLDPATDALQGASTPDKYQYVLTVPLVAPGTVFRYGPSHLAAFGAIMDRKLKADGRYTDVYDFIDQKVFQPIELKMGEWRRDLAGHLIMPGGAFITAREWVKYGELIRDQGVWKGQTILDKAMLSECFTGSAVFPAYGLTFWLNNPMPISTIGLDDVFPHSNAAKQNGLFQIAPGGPTDLVMMAGAGDERQYVIPSLDLVIIRFGRAAKGWTDAEFLNLALGKKN